MYSLVFLGALAGSALAQSAISFSNTTFTNAVVVDAVWPIHFTAGNGDSVAIAFGNETYAFQIVGMLSSKANSPTHGPHTNTTLDGLSAPGMFEWDVKVPVNVVDGLYQLALMQGDADPVFSPTFQLTGTQGAPTTDAPVTDVPFPTVTTATETTTATQTVTAIYLPGPDGQLHAAGNTTGDVYVTYIFYDEDCACHHTSSCPAAEMPASASMSSTTVTYSQEECGCTTTVEAPWAETVIPVVPVAPAAAATTPVPVAPAAATDMPVAPAATSAAPAAPAPVDATTAASPTMEAMPAAFTGGAGKLAGSSFGLAALLALLA